MNTVATILVAFFGGGVVPLVAVWMTQRYNDHQRDRDRRDEAHTHIRELVRELCEVAGELQLTMSMYVPRYNTWQPKLTTLGAAILEYGAGRASGGHFLGTARGGRVIVDATERELVATEGIRIPMQRMLGLSARVALEIDGPIRDAAHELAQAATSLCIAYGSDNLWRRAAAKAAREKVDAEMQDALRNLLAVTRDQLRHAPGPPIPRRRHLVARLRRTNPEQESPETPASS